MWLFLLAYVVYCKDLSKYGGVRLYAKSVKENADVPFKYIVANLQDAIENDAMECPFASTAGPLFTNIEYYMLRDRAFYKRFIPVGNLFPPTIPVTMKKDLALILPAPKAGKDLFQTMLNELVKYPKYDSACFKIMSGEKIQIFFYQDSITNASVDELLCEQMISFTIETGHSCKTDLWELNLKNSYDLFFAPLCSAAQLGTALTFVGSTSTELILTNRHYQKNGRFRIVQFEHQDDSLFRLMPIFDDIFVDVAEAIGSKLTSVAIVPRPKNTCQIRLYFSGSNLNMDSVMKWVKSLEACGIGYVHEIDHTDGILRFLLKNKLLRVVQPFDHTRRTVENSYGVTQRSNFEQAMIIFDQTKPGLALRFGHFACSESNYGAVAIETSISDAYDAFKLAVDRLIFSDVEKTARHIESVVLEWTEAKAVIRVVFLFDAIEMIGEERLVRQISAVDFGRFNKVATLEGPPPLAAFVSIDGLNAYLLGNDFWESVSEGQFFGPQEIFCQSECRHVDLLLISPNQVYRGLEDIKIVATDDIDFADLMLAMDLVNDESMIRVKRSPVQGKLKIEVGRWEVDHFLEKARLRLKLCPENGIHSMDQYLSLKPWAKCAYFPAGTPKESTPETSFAVHFLEGSQHLIDSYVKELIESECIVDVLSIELASASGPFVCVHFADSKHIRTLRRTITTKGITYQTISENRLALVGVLPLFVTFPNSTVKTSQFATVNEFMKLKSKATKKVPAISFTVDRRSMDPNLKAEQKIFVANFLVKKYNTVLVSFIEALTDKSFPELSLPFSKLVVSAHKHHFSIAVYVKKYLAGLGDEAYGNLLVQAAEHLEKHPGAKARKGNPAFRPDKRPLKPDLSIKTLSTRSTKADTTTIGKVGTAGNLPVDASANFSMKDESVKTVPSKIQLSNKIVQTLSVSLSPEEEMDWACYYEMIKNELEISSTVNFMQMSFVDRVKESFLQFRPDLGEGFRFLFSEASPFAIEKTWNGFAVAMDLVLQNLQLAIARNSLEYPCVIELKSSLSEPCLSYTQSFQISNADYSIRILLDAFECLAFNMLYDSIASNVIRIGVSRSEFSSQYIIFAELILLPEPTPEHSSSMDEFNLIWHHVVRRASQ